MVSRASVQGYLWTTCTPPDQQLEAPCKQDATKTYVCNCKQNYLIVIWMLPQISKSRNAENPSSDTTGLPWAKLALDVARIDVCLMLHAPAGRKTAYKGPFMWTSASRHLAPSSHLPTHSPLLLPFLPCSRLWDLVPEQELFTERSFIFPAHFVVLRQATWFSSSSHYNSL